MNQRDRILAILEDGQHMTALDALREFGCFRLAARIAELREQGHPINTTMVHVNGKEVAAYWMDRQPEQMGMFG